MDGAYLIKWAGYPDSQNTWEPRSHLPASVFDDDSDPLSCPFEVIATATASANAAALAAHKLALTPKPRHPDDVFSDSSAELPSSNDDWLPDTDNNLEPEEAEGGGDTEGYPENSPDASSQFGISARTSRNACPQTCPKKKIVTLARVMMQRSDSVESYFRPARHVANVVEVPDCNRGEFNDPTKPLLDGWLDAVDRKDKYDLSWTTVQPRGDLKKIIRVKGLNEAREKEKTHFQVLGWGRRIWGRG